MKALIEKDTCKLQVHSSSIYPTNAGDAGSVPGSGRSHGEGNSNPLHYSCLGNPKDKEARWATVHGLAKELDMT